jgi:hypothetical protein
MAIGVQPATAPTPRASAKHSKTSRGPAMIEQVIRFVLSNYPLVYFVIGLLVAGISLAWRRAPVTRAEVLEAVLAYYCLFGVGFYFVHNFVMHVFFGDVCAENIGWEDSPFQVEVGTASLGFGLVGLLAFRKDFGLRLAAIVGPACFLWGAAVGHVYQMVTEHNYAPGNAGIMFWLDVFLPAFGLILLAAWRRAQSDSAS